MPIPLRPIGFAVTCSVWLLLSGGVSVLAAQGPIRTTPGASTEPAREPAAPGAPVRDSAKTLPTKGRAVIRGRVVALDNGIPLRRVQVRISNPEQPMPRGSYTDAQGRYEFKELPAGRYQLEASKGGFVKVAFGQRRPLEGGRPIELADGQTLEKVDFHLPRGGVIVGRVVDELGETVTGASVQVLDSRRVSGKRRLVPVGYGQTNDLGQYRVFGLPPGEYYLATGGHESSMDEATTDNPSGSGYAQTYYPGTPNLGEAQRVTVNIGGEVSADLQLATTRVSKVSGTIVDQNGQPAGMAFVSLHLRDSMQGNYTESFSTATMGVGGAFSISNVSPGEYDAIGYILRNPLASDKRLTGLVSISVTGQDLEGIRIVATSGATIKGRVVYEGEARPENPLGFGLHVACDTNDSPDPMMMSNFSPAKVDDEGRFELGGVYRECLIRAFPTPDDWGIKAVTHDSQDVTDRPLAVKSTETITDVTITLTNRLARITGTVTDDDDRPAKDYVVIVFPEDADKLRPHSRFVRIARGDQKGEFKMTGLPPGAYRAAALDTVEEGAESDPEFIERIRPSSVPLRLGDEGQQTIGLKLNKSFP